MAPGSVPWRPRQQAGKPCAPAHHVKVFNMPSCWRKALWRMSAPRQWPLVTSRPGAPAPCGGTGRAHQAFWKEIPDGRAAGSRQVNAACAARPDASTRNWIQTGTALGPVCCEVARLLPSRDGERRPQQSIAPAASCGSRPKPGSQRPEPGWQERRALLPRLERGTTTVKQSAYGASAAATGPDRRGLNGPSAAPPAAAHPSVAVRARARCSCNATGHMRSSTAAG